MAVQNIEAKKRAAAVLDLIHGLSVRDVAKKHGFPKSTVGEWSTIITQAKGTNGSERRVHAYHAALEKVALKTMDALMALADLLGDKEYIRRLPTDELVTRFNLLSERLARHLEAERAFSPIEQPALPAASELIVPELVEGEPASLGEVA